MLIISLIIFLLWVVFLLTCVVFCDGAFYIAVGNIAAQNQAQQAQAQALAQAQAQAQSGAGNPTTMVPNPPGSVPVIAVGASLAAALIKGHKEQQQEAGNRSWCDRNDLP